MEEEERRMGVGGYAVVVWWSLSCRRKKVKRLKKGGFDKGCEGRWIRVEGWVVVLE